MAATTGNVSTLSTKRNVGRQDADQRTSAYSSTARNPEVNNQLRSEQLHSYHVQQGMAELGSTDGEQDLLGPPPRPQEVDQLRVPCYLDEGYAQSLRVNASASNQADSAQLDAMLKPFQHMMETSDVHPTQRFFTPGAPQDPTYYSKIALEELGTPYADGLSSENRAKIAELNYLDVVRGRQRQRRSSSNGLNFARQ